MELKLNVYKNQKEIEKTYSVDTFDLMTGTTEDFLNAINIDSLSAKTDKEIYLEIGKFITKNPRLIYGLLHDIFGITEEEWRKTKVKEVGAVLLKFLTSTCEEIARLANGKN